MFLTPLRIMTINAQSLQRFNSLQMQACTRNTHTQDRKFGMLKGKFHKPKYACFAYFCHLIMCPLHLHASPLETQLERCLAKTLRKIVSLYLQIRLSEKSNAELMRRAVFNSSYPNTHTNTTVIYSCRCNEDYSHLERGGEMSRCSC